MPISSSGHLSLVPWLFSWNDFGSAGTQKAFDVALHIGMLIAVCTYFGRRDALLPSCPGVLVLLIAASGLR